MDIVKKENIRVNDAFIKHLEIFNDRCQKILQKVIYFFNIHCIPISTLFKWYKAVFITLYKFFNLLPE